MLDTHRLLVQLRAQYARQELFHWHWQAGAHRARLARILPHKGHPLVRHAHQDTGVYHRIRAYNYSQHNIYSSTLLHSYSVPTIRLVRIHACGREAKGSVVQQE